MGLSRPQTEEVTIMMTDRSYVGWFELNDIQKESGTNLTKKSLIEIQILPVCLSDEIACYNKNDEVGKETLLWARRKWTDNNSTATSRVR